jgi:hypothetical protein
MPKYITAFVLRSKSPSFINKQMPRAGIFPVREESFHPVMIYNIVKEEGIPCDPCVYENNPACACLNASSIVEPNACRGLEATLKQTLVFFLRARNDNVDSVE